MKLIDLSCTKCGAHLQANPNQTFITCNHCGTHFYVDDGVKKYQFQGAEDAGYQFEKGRQRAIREAQMYNPSYYSTQNARQQVHQQKETPKLRWLFLWVLGWLIIFPVPASILIARQSTWSGFLKDMLIALMWFLYILLGVISGF